MTWNVWLQLVAMGITLLCLWEGIRFRRQAREAYRRGQEFLDFAKARAECPAPPPAIVVEVDSTEQLH